MLGRYSRDGIQDISADRTRQVGELVEKLGGKVEAIFAVLGKYDLVLRLQLPDTASVEEFDRLAGD
jgi:uncharacterized protein with GYD domain